MGLSNFCFPHAAISILKTFRNTQNNQELFFCVIIHLALVKTKMLCFLYPFWKASRFVCMAILDLSHSAGLIKKCV